MALSVTLTCALLLTSSVVLAHGMDGGQLRAHVRGNTVRMTLTPAAKAFSAFDKNGNGRLDAHEVSQQREKLKRAVLASLKLEAKNQGNGSVTLLDFNPLTGHHDKPGKHLRITMHVRWKQPLTTLSIAYPHGATAPLRITASKSLGNGNQKVMRARFDAKHSKHSFHFA